ncbi:hypothetical protein [Endozoicomonas ascidiicola]|nr:hypothetical protein [Endozoicomonas ascidiicola]
MTTTVTTNQGLPIVIPTDDDWLFFDWRSGLAVGGWRLMIKRLAVGGGG